MQSEYKSILRDNTLELVDLAPKKKVIVGTKRIWKDKYKANGTLKKYKAKLVAQGFSYVERFDF